MAITSKLQVITKDSNNKELNRTVSYVNPETSDYDLKNFATAYSGLSSRTFTDVYRINREDVTNATTETDITPADTGTTIVDTGTTVDTSTKVIPGTTETSTIAANISTDSGVLTITSPWFTTANADIFVHNLFVDLVNDGFRGKTTLTERYTYVSDFVPDGTSDFFVYGVLDDGVIIDDDSCFANAYLEISTSTLRQKSYISTKLDAIDATVTGENTITLIRNKNLTLSAFLAALNASYASAFASNTKFATPPTFTHDGAAGTIVFDPHLANVGDSCTLTLQGQADRYLMIKAVNLIGADLFTPYVSSTNWVFTLTR